MAHAVGAVEGAIWVLTVLALAFSVGGDWRDALGVGVFLGSTAAAGWLVASRVPANPLGWLLLFVAGCFLLSVVTFGLLALTHDRWPGVAAWLAWFTGSDDNGWIWLPPIGVLFTQVLLRFPDGRLPSPRWTWFSRFTVFALVLGSLVLASAPGELRYGIQNPMAQEWLLDQQGWVVPLIALMLLVCFVGSVGSLVVRYRRAGGEQREQLRWIAWAASLVVAAYVLSFFSPWPIYDLMFVAYGLIPLAIVMAILRYRLYEIDRIISRTASYAIVTALVLGTYALVVTTLTRLLPTSSTLSVAAATLAAAALARPLLTRVQGVVDRRFNRSRYDAARTVEAFGERLRTEVDADDVAAGLEGVIVSTLQPSAVGLWLSSR